MKNLSRRYLTAVDNLPLMIMSEFDEQPGLHLTFAQVRRLWDLSEPQCHDVLIYLIRQGLLSRDGDRQYCRPDASGILPGALSSV